MKQAAMTEPKSIDFRLSIARACGIDFASNPGCAEGRRHRRRGRVRPKRLRGNGAGAGDGDEAYGRIDRDPGRTMNLIIRVN